MNIAHLAPTDIQSRLGVLWVFRFDPDSPAILLDRDAMPDLTGETGFLWVHLDLVDERARKWIAAEPAIPAQAGDLLIGHEQHQCLDHSADQVWGVVHDVGRDAVGKSHHVSPLHWAIGQNYLVTGRREPLQAISLTADGLRKGERTGTPAALFERIIAFIIQDIAAAVLHLTDEIDALEDQLLANRLSDTPKRIGRLRRAIVRLQRHVSGLHLLFRRFSEAEIGPAAPATVKSAAMRLLQRIDTLRHDVQVLHERTRLLQEEAAAATATESGRQLHFLSILTALFLPATFITGMFGVNAKGVPWDDTTNGFAYVLLVCLACSLLTLFVLKRRGIVT
ncbi:CorA family divalent cation transporter [Bosea sp. NPDC055332]